MALVGNEIVVVQGLCAGVPSAETFTTTTAAIAALAGVENPVVTGLVANVTSTQASGTALTLGAFNNVTTVGGSGYSVKLPLAFVGAQATVANQGANAMQIFGTSPDTINGIATATGISIPVGAVFVFTCAVLGNWISSVETAVAVTGTFDGIVGGITPAAGTFTTVTASGAVSTTAATATATSNQLILGTTRTLTLTAPTPASSSRVVTLPDPGGADSVAYLALAQTLTNKTLTGPILTDIYRTSSAVTKNANVTPGTVTGLAGAIAIGTYRFKAVLPSTVASGTGGIAYNFLLTTAVLSAIQYGATMKTSAALQYTQGTTATSGTVMATQAAVVLETIIEGTFTVSTAGTFTIQMCQAASNASDSIALLGGSLELTRIA